MSNKKHSNSLIEAVRTKNELCIKCQTMTQFDFYKDDWFCNDCWMNRQAAKSFNVNVRKIPEENSGNPGVDAYIELAIKTTLLIALFPISLLFLVVFFGMSETINIVKQLFVELFATAIALLVIAVALFLLLVFLLKIFGL